MGCKFEYLQFFCHLFIITISNIIICLLEHNYTFLTKLTPLISENTLAKVYWVY